jgi:hypothetical protein
MLTLEDGTVFATSSAPYVYLPTESPRVNVEIEVGGNRLSAVVDTGAPYFICGEQIAAILDLVPSEALEEKILSTRLGVLNGRLFRTIVTLVAQEGSSVELEATAFVVSDRRWDDQPLFLGLLNCLDRLRFAIDPVSEVFHFGKP